MEGYRPETELLLQLMRAALCRPDSALDWMDGCSAPALAEQIEEQSLVTMLYPTIRGQAGEAWEALAARLKPVYDRELHRGLMQEYEIGALLDDLERDGIDCLPMKGWVMRQYYPDPLLRSMADFDVLIREMDSRRMQKWMEARGYAPDHIEQSVHDTYRKPPYMNIELHRRLMEEGRLRRQHTAWRENCLASLWQPGFRLEGKAHIYRLSDEDFLVHHLLHFYKHFTGSGVGLRPLADLYLFLQKKGQTLDRAYLEKQLEALHILAFARHGAAGAGLPGRAGAGPKRAPGGGVPDPYRDLRGPRHDGDGPPVPKRGKNHRAKQAERLFQPLLCAAGNDEKYLSAPAPCALAAAVLLGGPDRADRLSGAL